MAPPETYFSASRAEFASVAPGWLLPEANVESPRELVGVNPFLKTELRSWDYRNPQQPEQPESSSLPNLGGLMQFQSGTLTAVFYGHLLNAVSGADPERVTGQIFGQELISSGEHEVEMFLLLPELWLPLARVADDQIESLVNKWRAPPARIVRTGFTAKLFGKYTGETLEPHHPTRDEKREALAQIRKLAVHSLELDKSVFILTST